MLLKQPDNPPTVVITVPPCVLNETSFHIGPPDLWNTTISYKKKFPLLRLKDVLRLLAVFTIFVSSCCLSVVHLGFSGSHQMIPQRRNVSWSSSISSYYPSPLQLTISSILIRVTSVSLTANLHCIADSNTYNAYVSGLSTELDFNSNQLVHFQTLYALGAAFGQIPMMVLFPYVPMHRFIPTMDIIWGVFTLLQFRVRSYGEMATYRFLVGLFESAYFPAAHFVLGSWYKRHELARRGGIFYLGLYLAAFTVALIQKAASERLDGKAGLSGWRWMYVITGIMTLGTGLVSFLLWPGTVNKPHLLFLTKEDLEMAKRRMIDSETEITRRETDDTKSRSAESDQHESEPTRPTLLTDMMTTLRRGFSSKSVWLFIIGYVLYINTNYLDFNGGYLLWLKSLNRYSVARINMLFTIAPCLGIVYDLALVFASDLWIGRAAAITVCQIFCFFSVLVLSIWNVPEGVKWVAFNLTYMRLSMVSIIFGWANDVLRHNEKVRSIGLVAMNIAGQSTTIWIPLIFFKTTDAPRWRMGYPFCASVIVVFIIWTWVSRAIFRRQE